MNTPNIESAQWVGYGFLRIPQERFNEAIAAFNQAIELEKDSLLAYQGGARCYTFLLHGNISDKAKVDPGASDLEKSLSSARRLSDEIS